MKKFVALLMVAMLACVSVSTALAATASISWSGTSTGWNIWSSNVSVDGSDWKIEWGTNNLSEVTAKVKIWKSDGDPASHTFYYTSASNASHGYLEAYDSSVKVHVDGGRKTQGSEALTVHGTFYP